MFNQLAFQNLNLRVTKQFFPFYGPCLTFFWNFSFRNSSTVLLPKKKNQTKKNQYTYFIIQCNKENASKLTTCLTSNVWLFLNTAPKGEDVSPQGYSKMLQAGGR